jgi:hypothetical protein
MGLTEEFIDPEALEERPVRRRRRTGGNGAFMDMLTILLLVGMLVMGLVFGAIYLNPYVALNPFPPPAAVPTVFIPTGTPTQKSMPPTWTATSTLEPTVTGTPVPPTATVTSTPTETPTPTNTPPASAYKYVLRGTPAVLSGQVIHPDDGCKLWVAGQALDMKGAPVVGITVQMGGSLDKPVYLLSLTGTALQYGQGGYEFILAEKSVASKQSVWVQLLDQEGYPLSGRVYIDTFDGCEKNLILVNYKQVR